MIAGWAIDWLSVFVLGALTLLDGVRRLPRGAHVLRRVGNGDWSVATPEEDGRRLLVSWWTPFTLRLAVPPSHPEGGRADRLAERLPRTWRWIAELRVLGAMVLIGVVVGIPVATETLGWRGLLLALLGIEMIAVAITATALLVLRRLGLGMRAALRQAAGLLSPFAAPRAAEIVLEQAIAGAPPLLTIRQLVPRRAFDSWIRPRAHDLLHGDAPADPELEDVLTRSDLARIVGAPPQDRLPHEPWCARCGRIYRTSTSCCADCDALQLMA